MSFHDLPDEIVRMIIDHGSVQQAGILKTVSKSMHRLVQESRHDIHLPLQEPEYRHRRTGKYQSDYDALVAMVEHTHAPDFSLRRLVRLHLLLLVYEPGSILRNIHTLRHDPVGIDHLPIDEIVATLRDVHPSPRAHEAARHLARDLAISPDDEARYGRLVFDALVLVLREMYGPGTDKIVHSQHMHDAWS